MFKPVQELIQDNSLIRDDYKLQFKTKLGVSIDAFASSLFTLLKLNVGEFRSEDESYNTVRRLGEGADFDNREDAVTFAQSLHDKIAAAAATIGDKVEHGDDEVRELALSDGSVNHRQMVEKWPCDVGEVKSSQPSINSASPASGELQKCHNLSSECS